MSTVRFERVGLTLIKGLHNFVDKDWSPRIRRMLAGNLLPTFRKRLLFPSSVQVKTILVDISRFQVRAIAALFPTRIFSCFPVILVIRCVCY